MQYNPYEYMLELRNNRILFQYLEFSAVNFNEQHGWTITGQSKEGKTEIYETASGVLRYTLPIPVPSFITMDILLRILEGLQGSIEGIVTPAEDEDGVYIEYHLHAPSDLEHLDAALLKFISERAEIEKGFASLEDEYRKMEKAMGSITEGLASMMNEKSDAPAPKKQSSQRSPKEEDLTSLWNEMENIDTKDDDDDFPDDGEGQLM